MDDSFRLHRYLKREIDAAMIAVLSMVILIPAIIWLFVMFFGSDATGLPYHLQFSATKDTVVAFQNIVHDQKRTRSPILIALVCFHVLQFIGTIWFYFKILYLAYMSSTKVASRVEMEDGVDDPNNARLTNQVTLNERKKYNREEEDSINILGKELLAIETISSQIDQQDKRLQRDNGEIYIADQNNKKTSLDEKMIRGTVEKTHTNKQFANAPNVTSNILLTSKGNTNCHQSVRKTKNTHLKRHAFQRVSSDGRRLVIQPKLGDHVVNIPCTNVVVCISQKDIICTIGLACQLLSLIITFILTIFAFRISGKIVTVYEFFRSYYCLESALIINSVVDPIVCVVFSHNFREAFKNMMVRPKINERRK